MSDTLDDLRRQAWYEANSLGQCDNCGREWFVDDEVMVKDGKPLCKCGEAREGSFKW